MDRADDRTDESNRGKEKGKDEANDRNDIRLYRPLLNGDADLHAAERAEGGIVADVFSAFRTKHGSTLPDKRIEVLALYFFRGGMSIEEQNLSNNLCSALFEKAERLFRRLALLGANGIVLPGIAERDDVGDARLFGQRKKGAQLFFAAPAEDTGGKSRRLCRKDEVRRHDADVARGEVLVFEPVPEPCR